MGLNHSEQFNISACTVLAPMRVLPLFYWLFFTSDMKPQVSFTGIKYVFLLVFYHYEP